MLSYIALLLVITYYLLYSSTTINYTDNEYVFNTYTNDNKPDMERAANLLNVIKTKTITLEI